MGTCDVLIVGSGIIGLTSAYHIKRLNPDLDVLVVDQFGMAGQGDTAKSAGAFRAFFSSRTNFLLANTSIDFYRHVQEKLKFDLGMRFNGYLFLLTKGKYVELKGLIDEVGRKGVPYRYVDTKELKEYGVNTEVSHDEEAVLMGLEDVYVGLLIKKAGILKPERLVEFYECECKRLGTRFLFNTKVKALLREPLKPLGIPGEPFPWQDSEITGVITQDGKVIKARKKVILATGSWTPQLLEPLGLPSVIRTKKRQIFVVKAETPKLRKLLFYKGFSDEGFAPFTILPKHMFFRPSLEEESFWIGYADPYTEFKFEENPLPEERFYIEGIYPVLVKYFPQFTDMRPSTSWAGLYDVNPIDEGPLVYEVSNVIVAAGTSGSGIMKADAVGRVVAAVLKGEDEAELFGGEVIKVKDLSLSSRSFEPERLVL